MTVPFEDPEYLEACYAALFELLKAAPLISPQKWQTTQRLVQISDDFVIPRQPALIQVESAIRAEQKEVFGPTKWILGAVAVVYMQAEGGTQPTVVPATAANRVIWALARTFDTKPPYQKQTLGGLVYHCWVDGNILAEVVDQQIIITAPISILPGPVG